MGRYEVLKLKELKFGKVLVIAYDNENELTIISKLRPQKMMELIKNGIDDTVKIDTYKLED